MRFLIGRNFRVWIFLFVVHFSSEYSNSLHAASRWETSSGKSYHGRLVSFDFQQKIVHLENEITKEKIEISTSELDLPSKRNLLFSRIFHSSFPTEATPWPPEKLKLFLLAGLIPIVLSVFSFWISGLLVTGKINPFRAVVGFIGSWLCGLVLMGCYFSFSQHSGGGTGILWLGAGLAAIIVSIYVSAIYTCSAFKGFQIFVLHIIGTLVLGTALVYGGEIVIPREKVVKVWDQFIFAPTGLIDSPE